MGDFPSNVVDLLAEFLENADGADKVVRRPIRITDGHGFIGISALDWVPVDPEIGGPPDAGLSRYNFRIEGLVKHANEEEGRAEHTVFAKIIRTMLYRDRALRIRLGQLNKISSDGVKEAVSRWGVRQQRFASNEVQGQFLYLSTTDLWVETSTA